MHIEGPSLRRLRGFVWIHHIWGAEGIMGFRRLGVKV